MNTPSNIPAPDGGGSRNWLDPYLPETLPAAYQPQPQRQFFDIPAIRGMLYRQRWLIAGVLVAAAIAGLVATLLATPMYEARSSVRIEPYGSFIVEGQDIERGVASNQVYNLLSTQIGIITSRALANTVAENLDLAEREDFLGPDIDERRPPNMSDAAWHDAKQRMAAEKLHASVSAEIPANNWIIEIAYRSESPTIAAEMANAYSDAFVAADRRESLENNEYAQNYLREQIELVRERLQAAEQAANDYARSAGIIMQPGGDEEEGSFATLTATNLASINARVAAARAARIEAEQRWRALQGLDPGQLSEVQNNALLQGLIAQRTNKQNELTSLRQRLGAAHPEIVSLQAQIEELDSQILQRSNDIKSTARTQYLVARNQEEALEQELRAATGATLEEQERQVQYGVLEREAQALRDQLEALLNRYNQVSTAANVDTGFVNPLDSAVVPAAPYTPNLLRNMALALVLGAALAGGLVIVREAFDDKIRSLDEVESKLGLPLLGHTPFVEEYNHAEEADHRFSPLLEAYNAIRSTIEFALPRDANVVQFASSQASEGKSTTALIMAELFAGVGRRTLLVEADLRRPSIAKALGIAKPKVGLLEVLSGQVDLQAATVPGLNQNLDILPVGETPSNPTEVLASSQLRDFIARYRQEYSLIIFDSPPMLGLADAAMLSTLVDATIFVLEANGVAAGQARAAIKRLRASGGHPIGIILTKFRALEAGESYDYQYSYYNYSSES